MYQHDAIMRTEELSSEDLEIARKKAYSILYFNPKWWLQNVGHTIRHMEDLPLSARYAVKILNNFLFRNMEHGH